jgi:hypothetical protein
MTGSPTRPPPSTEAALAATTAALLDQGRIPDRLSQLLTVGAVLLLLFLGPLTGHDGMTTAVLLLALSVRLGLIELYFAFRVGFDAALFRALAAGTALPNLPALDASLLRLGLRPAAATPRPLEDRIDGARKLLRRQVWCLVLQLAAMIAAAGFLALE